jgi:hypothetical protein
LRLALALACGMATLPALANDLDEAVAAIAAGEPKDRVLHQLQAASVALDSGAAEDAGALFDQAIAGISTVYANSEQAAAARSLWQNEGAKDFKGEPYERAMAFYYRGLLDLWNADYENARASFRSGLLQDAFAEEAQHRTDFALLMFLDGWASLQLGAEGLAGESFAEFAQYRPGFPLPSPDHDLLIIAETGKAPRKLQDGVGGNLLTFRPGKRFGEQGAAARIGGETVRLLPAESIFWQASSRGGRPIDGILEGQVQFKQTTQGTANAISGVASEAAIYAPLFGASGGALAGVAGVFGVASLAVSGVKARADDRYWNNLPDMVHLYTMKRPEGVDEIAFDFIDASGQVIPALSTTAKIRVDSKGRAVAWVRSRRATDIDKRLESRQ